MSFRGIPAICTTPMLEDGRVHRKRLAVRRAAIQIRRSATTPAFSQDSTNIDGEISAIKAVTVPKKYPPPSAQ